MPLHFMTVRQEQRRIIVLVLFTQCLHLNKLEIEADDEKKLLENIFAEEQ